MTQEMQTSTINDILYKHDLMNTSCTMNEGMEDEYWSVADYIIEKYMEDNVFTLDLVRDCLLDLFPVGEDFIDHDTLVKVYEEMLLTIEE